MATAQNTFFRSIWLPGVQAGADVRGVAAIDTSDVTARLDDLMRRKILVRLEGRYLSLATGQPPRSRPEMFSGASMNLHPARSLSG